jgi:hypothetical protein
MSCGTTIRVLFSRALSHPKHSRPCVRENLHLHFLIFVCVFACNREGTSHTSSRVDGRFGMIKAFDKKGPHTAKFSVKYKDDPNWCTHSLLREGYGKDKHWVLLGIPSRESA